MRNVHVSLYYRASYLGKDGAAPLLLAVNHANSSCYIPISGIRLKPDQWDKARKRVINHPHQATMNGVALSLLGRAQDAVLEIMRQGGVRGLTTAQVRDRVASILYPEGERDTGVLAVMRNYMARCRKPNTAAKFEQTLSHLERWLGASSKRLRFGDITPEWLGDFDRHLTAYSPSVNSRAIHLRNLRTVFNYAIANNVTDAHYPFKHFKIKTAPAQHVTLTVEQMRQLWQHVPQSKAEAYWLDVWKLSFCLIGINMADLATLTAVSQGRVNYTRAKTGRVYSVKLEQAAKELIERHRGRGRLLDILEHCVSVQRATKACNRHLKYIAEDLNLPPLTVYTARYTWATVASGLGVPIEVISQALGHTYGLTVTLGYIMPDRRKVDEANKNVLALICG